VERAAATKADAREGAAATNALAVDLYRRLLVKGDNLVFSPTSIMLALAMARPGARGDTADEMDVVMHDAATAAHAAWLNGLEAQIASRNVRVKDRQGVVRTVRVRIANAAFLQRGYPFEERFLDALAGRFGAGVRLVDYRSDPAAARKAINAWVKRRTDDRIPKLLAPADVRPETRFALVNAVFLQAPWATTFSPDETASAAFKLAGGERVRVPTMTGPKELTWVQYAWGKGWRAAELPYIGGKLAMTVILPDEIAAFERGLTAKRLTAIVDKVAAAPMEYPDPAYPDDPGIAWKIALPKFSFQSRADLAKALAAAGMPAAFDPALADFTGIVDPAASGEPGLFIRKVIHQATIEVDERGTTATASTAVLGETGGGPTTKVFRVNRPFLFVIRDVPTGAILFLGRVMDPRAG
jgi:serpin B